MEGLRVVRGPDWKWDDEDGGEGHVGTIGEIDNFNRFSERTARVKWDSGRSNIYRIGRQSACDLRIVDNAPSGVRHPSITCDSCGMLDIAGMRWKCGQCEDFDLCTQCYMSDKHDLTHPFVRYETANPCGVEVPIRKDAVKIVKKGIFLSAKVIRGPDWEWGNQDVGIGVVLEIVKWSDAGRAAARVLWSSGERNTYRVGYEGKVDLKYTEEGTDGCYYGDHLPICGDDMRTNETECCDNVTIKKTENEEGDETITEETVDDKFAKNSKSDETITEETVDDKFAKNSKSWALLSQNLEDLFLSDQLCDFTVKVEDREFQIHKSILGARSSVFASMFQHDMKEKNTGIVEISDCDPTIFEDFLFYLYSGKTERISHENATALYEVGIKYDVQGLKEECVHFMKRSLTVDFICDAMALAVRHGDRELIEMATEYFISNAREILPTVKWQVFMKENPVPANELYIKAFDIAINKK